MTKLELKEIWPAPSKPSSDTSLVQKPQICRNFTTEKLWSRVHWPFEMLNSTHQSQKFSLVARNCRKTYQATTGWKASSKTFRLKVSQWTTNRCGSKTLSQILWTSLRWKISFYLIQMLHKVQSFWDLKQRRLSETSKGIKTTFRHLFTTSTSPQFPERRRTIATNPNCFQRKSRSSKPRNKVH